MSRRVYLIAYYKTYIGEVNYSPEWMNRDNISFDEVEGKIYLGSSGLSAEIYRLASSSGERGCRKPASGVGELTTAFKGIFLKEDIDWDDEGGLTCGYHWYGPPDAVMQLLFHPDIKDVLKKNWSENFLQEFFKEYAYCVIALQVV